MKDSPTPVQLLAALFARLIINTAQRMIYPFLPAFSRGLGVPLDALTLVLSVRGGLGLSAPLFSVLPDRLGRKPAMLIGLGVFSAALAALALWPSYGVFFAALLLITISKFIFDPSLQAYLSERIPYTRRGVVMAFMEVGWSGAFLLGIPLIGVAIAASDWRAPFLPLAGAGIVAALILWRLLPAGPNHAATQTPTATPLLHFMLRQPAIWGALSIGLLASIANELLNTVYGAWMEQTFQLKIASLGLTTIAIGIAELAGEGVVMGVVDRWGKRRTIALALGMSAAANALLPFMSGSLALALAGLFLVFITFEVAIVSSLPLVSEMLPEARGLMMTTNIAFHGIGRMVGALLGGWLFALGFAWTGFTAMGLYLSAVIIVLIFVKEKVHAL